MFGVVFYPRVYLGEFASQFYQLSGYFVFLPLFYLAFLLGFKGDLYGKKMRLEFVERLRDEEKFPSAEALVRQMTRDVEAARRALEKAEL